MGVRTPSGLFWGTLQPIPPGGRLLAETWSCGLPDGDGRAPPWRSEGICQAALTPRPSPLASAPASGDGQGHSGHREQRAKAPGRAEGAQAGRGVVVLGPARAARPSRGALRVLGGGLALVLRVVFLELEWKGSSAPSGHRACDPARGAGTASWVPQFTLSPEALTLGLQAERALGAAGCPRSQDLAAPGGTEATAGGRGLPSPACLETKQTLLSCPPAPASC